MTTTGYGISGIGYPMMGLGNMGLGGVSGFSSYDAYMPSSMGMGYGMSPYGMGMGMMNPAFMAQMHGDMEKYQLNHAAEMQKMTLDYETSARDLSNSALVKKVLSNGSIQQGVQNLYTKVRERDMKGVCEEFDKLRNYIANAYSEELKQYYKANPEAGIVEVIENLYASIISQQEGRVADLRSDIKSYGDDAFRNGFMSTFKKGHGDIYTEEALNHCFGMSINNKEHLDFTQKVGAVAGGAAHAIKMGGIGAAVGGSAFTIANLLTTGTTALLPNKKVITDAAGNQVRKIGFFENLFKGNKIKLNQGEKIVKASRTVGFSFKKMGKVGLAVGIAAMVADLGHSIYKACNKDKS